PSSVTPTFVAPSVGSEGASLSFRLTVTDSGTLQSTDTCIVNVTWDNESPVADAGPNQTVNEGTTVTLDGSSSFDPDGNIASYRWTQTTGPSVTLSDPTEVMPTFVTPPVDATGAVLEFQLTVTDNGGLENSDSMAVTILDNGITVFSKDVISTRLSSGEAIGFREGKDSKLISLSTIEQFKMPTDANNEPLSLVVNDLIDMKIKVPIPGDEAKVTVYLDKTAPDESTLYHYSRIDSAWSDYSEYAEFNATRNQIKITLVDGGMGDDDEVADGIIVDPFAFVLSSDSSTVPPSEDEDEEDSSFNRGCFIGASADGNFINTVKGSKKQNAILSILLCGVVFGMRFRDLF
ncbi:MAG: hypothetical protein JXR54_07405, partial [Tannerellaceae bacterium]|nr:hypothetical protein [Tannerellaceae bacterium]